MDLNVEYQKENMQKKIRFEFENIMLEVPMRVVKDDARIKSEGKGWKILDSSASDKNEEYIDPRLAKLKDYFKQ